MPSSGVYCTRLLPTTILFADGNADTRFAYHSLATAEGFRAVLARNGLEAVVLAQRMEPDAIVLETRLDGLCGFEVIRRIRSSPATRSKVVVILSDEDGDAYDARVKASGCDARLVKPCAMTDLFRLLSALHVRASRGSDCEPGVARRTGGER